MQIYNKIGEAREGGRWGGANPNIHLFTEIMRNFNAMAVSLFAKIPDLKLKLENVHVSLQIQIKSLRLSKRMTKKD